MIRTCAHLFADWIDVFAVSQVSAAPGLLVIQLMVVLCASLRVQHNEAGKRRSPALCGLCVYVGVYVYTLVSFLCCSYQHAIDDTCAFHPLQHFTGDFHGADCGGGGLRVPQGGHGARVLVRACRWTARDESAPG
jgi:hypothetical protein